MTIDESKSLEQLENNYWPEGDFGSGLTKSCHLARKIPLSALSIENLRVLVSQDIGTEYLVPIAIRQLKQNLLAEGDHHEGDLLTAVLHLDKRFWLKNPNLSAEMADLLEKSVAEIDNSWLSTEIGKTTLELIDSFKKDFSSMMQTKELQKAWLKAATDIGIEVEVSAILGLDDDDILIKNFGSSRGTLVISSIDPKKEQKRFEASRNGLFYSFVNPNRYAPYSRQLFIDTLNDWVYFGRKEERPSWYTGESWN
jgi:hypothetical protein